MADMYGSDVLSGTARRRRPEPAVVEAVDGLVVEEPDSGFCGAVVGFSKSVVGLAVRLEDQRGRVVGVYSMIGSGMRTGNGITIGWLGALLGVSGAVAAGGAALVVGALLIGVLIALQTRRGATA